MVSIMSFAWLLPLLFISCYPKFTNTSACDTLQAGDPEDACEYLDSHRLANFARSFSSASMHMFQLPPLLTDKLVIRRLLQGESQTPKRRARRVPRVIFSSHFLILTEVMDL
jgi:hypothetical protein